MVKSKIKTTMPWPRRVIIKTKKRRKHFLLRKRKHPKIVYKKEFASPFYSKEAIHEYIVNNRKIPSVDFLLDLSEGNLVKTLYTIIGRKTKPSANRKPVVNFKYYRKIMISIPENTSMMFLEHHTTLPTWCKFCIVGGGIIWIDISQDFGRIGKIRL